MGPLQKTEFEDFFKKIIVSLCGVCVYLTAYMWRSKDDLWTGFPLPPSGSWESKSGGPFPLNHLTSPSLRIIF